MSDERETAIRDVIEMAGVVSIAAEGQHRPDRQRLHEALQRLDKIERETEQ